MAKIIECKKVPGQLYFACPACKTIHRLNRSWSYNEDPHAPTLHPSVLVTTKRTITDDEHTRIMAGEKINLEKRICHSFVKDGFIQFLNDCTHSLAGKTVKLPEVQEEN